MAPHDVLGQQFAARLLKPGDACIAVTGSSERDSEILASRISHALVLNAVNLAVQRISGQPAFGPAGELADLLSDTLEGQ